ncbi:outer membrane beta-barrel family protein [uncultured Parabacteroides sp.]|uniref:outer membrane beta-barrel family protein n=1 Tax=uncultured Parabacteroides sp. TaxID=512312 RepID=UPI00258FE321|nr:outer membrane beta-barrel family protein [uncultured Parabacteroides sp.]
MSRSKFLLATLSGLFSLGDISAQFIMPDTIPDQDIGEVVVVAKLPELEIKADKMTYHLDASVVRKQGSLYEVLETLPGVVVTQDGTIYMNGQSGINVLMDGKQTYLSGQELVNLLKATPASMADKIDLIIHPSARYDASGNSGIIDIHTKKIKLQGLNLSVNGSFSQGKFGKGDGSFSLNRRSGKLNFFLTYSYYQGTSQNDLEVDRIFSTSFTGLDEELNMHQDSYRESPYKSHYYRVGADIYLSPLTTLGFTASGNLLRSENNGTMLSSFYMFPLSTPDSTLSTQNLSDRKKNNFSGGVNLTHHLNQEGGLLDASLDYFYFDNVEDQYVYNAFQNKINQLTRQDSIRGDINGDINLYTGQINLTLPFENGWVLSAGGKSSYVSIDNEALYANRYEDGWVPNSYSQAFSYKENINAVYVQGNAKFESLSVQAGLRLENTRIKGRMDAVSDSSFKNHYTNLFPTLLLEYPVSKGKLSLFYGKRIVRPNYGDLNPSAYIFDDYTYERGNTLLKPETTDNIEVSYAFKELFKAGFLFSYTHDAIVKSYILEENKRVFVTPLNLTKAITLGPRVNTGILPLTSFWNLNANAAFIFNRYQWSEELENKVNKHATWIAGLNNQFSFGRGWGAELTASYNGKMAAGQATISPIWQVHAGLQKKILKNNGSINLFVRDMFHSYRYKMSLEVPGQRASTYERNDNTVVGISFSYRFKKGNESKERAWKNGTDETKRVNL